MLLALILLTQQPDSIPIRALDSPPASAASIDSVVLGRPSVRIPTTQGTAFIWLLRASDTVFIAASMPDSTLSWRDDFVLSLDTEGDAAPRPQHDDFQWDLRRVLDSSVIYRGRNGRWDRRETIRTGGSARNVPAEDGKSVARAHAPAGALFSGWTPRGSL